MDVVTIERDFTAWLAGKLNLTVDNGIFRGGIPEGLGQGVAVIFGSEVKSPGFYGFRPRTWNVQILAKFDDRDAALVFQTALNGVFPVPGFRHGSTSFTSATPRGSSEPYSAEDGGVVKTYVSYNITLVVLTTGCQTVTN